jgi:hypothetical protein
VRGICGVQVTMSMVTLPTATMGLRDSGIRISRVAQLQLR